MIELDVARSAQPLPVWGWEIPVYLFLGGVAAGVMVAGALLSRAPGRRSAAVRALAFAPPALLSLGMLALFLDLERGAHVFRFYLALRPRSPMSWGAWILVLVYPASILAALASLDDGAVARLEAAAPGPAAWIRRARELALARAGCVRRWNLGLGVALGVYTGVLLSTLGARALWASALLGPLFLASGLSTGTAFLLLFRLSDDERHLLGRWDLAAIGAEAALLVLFLAGLVSSDAAGRAAAGLLLGGRFTAPFWTLVGVGGLLLPVALEVLGRRRGLPFTRVAPALVLAGGFALRWIIVAAGQA